MCTQGLPLRRIGSIHSRLARRPRRTVCQGFAADLRRPGSTVQGTAGQRVAALPNRLHATPRVTLQPIRTIAARLAAELPGVTVRLTAVRYVCAPRLPLVARIFDDDEFFSRDAQGSAWMPV